MDTRDIHVELRGIGKRFGAIDALQDVNLSFQRGLVHAIVGENGAGKSTLGRLIAGVHSPDVGNMYVDGKQVRYGSPRTALDDGITIIAQELMLVPHRSVLENVFLGDENSRVGVVRTTELRARYGRLCESAGFSLDPGVSVGSLRLADQQKVEILRALARQSRLVVMDEPTAALSAEQADRLLEVVHRLRDAGTTVIFVSHFLDQVLSVADTVTVLRDGAVVHQAQADQESAASLVTSMLGRPMATVFPARVRPPADAPVVLSVRNLSRRRDVQDVSFDVRAGEILGIAGLVGSGRTELVRTVFGADRADSGEILVDGVLRRIHSPRDAVRAGLALIPESRKDQGLLLGASIQSNIALPHLAKVGWHGLIWGRAEGRACEPIAQQVGIRGASLDKAVSTLSGGNQQKTMFAKWLMQRSRVLIVDEPTRGVDVGAKQTIYQLISSLAAEGMAVLMVSSEAEEVLGLAHRVLVMRHGRVVGEFDGDSLDENRLLQAAFETKEVQA